MAQRHAKVRGVANPRGAAAWVNSTLVQGDVTTTVARLKREMERDLLVLGSGELVGSLMRHRLVDELVLLIHPIVLGSGRRLFADGGPESALQLIGSSGTPEGVVVATYHPVG